MKTKFLSFVAGALSVLMLDNRQRGGGNFAPILLQGGKHESDNNGREPSA